MFGSSWPCDCFQTQDPALVSASCPDQHCVHFGRFHHSRVEFTLRSECNMFVCVFFYLPYIKWSDPNTEQSLVQSLKSQANTLVQQVTDTVTDVLNLFVNDRSVWREMPLFCLSHSAVHVSGSTERKNMSTLWIHKGKRKLKSCLSWNGHRLWWKMF